ncbi:DUF3426 domain-containing protein [Reinekea marina]|uniref:DUF3426 domain-containing protein n=1 Tax=Reinekea marina TaxID=1310421 RepID=A0ABV7WPM2_9GAMM|nr:DUF3426 domain-containing protein [Reinekea marina]MDN3648506.1 DUF3426 domain-containing protein [Reinekea marina]
MAESFITQCPHCGTSFRVRTEQLAVANGSVRCGACLQVFSARNHLVTTSIPAQTPGKAAPVAKRAQPKTPAKSATKPAAKPKPVAKPKPTPPPRPSPAEESSQFLADDDDDAEFLFGAEEEEEFLFSDGEDDDELFDEDEQNDSLGELSDSFLNLNASSQPNARSDHFKSETQSLETDLFKDDEDENDESWAESMLEEIEKEDVSLSKPAVFESRNVGTPQNHTDTHNAAMRRSPLFVDLEENQTAAQPKSASQVVNQASQELDLDFHYEERLSRLRPLGWLLVILLLALLMAQLAWMQRDTYARMDQWRGLYSAACDIIGCQLPEQVDVTQIRTSVIVRDHKNTALKDIKMVDIVLTNRAPFKQPFPELILQYSDVNGKIVADQNFLPADYLKGEMTGVVNMPLNTRVYVSIPIKAPAPNAINYQLILNPINQ